MKRLLALKASAGSGKTFALAVRYISLMVKGANPDEIFALTFTNKAANEMKSRISNILEVASEHWAEVKEIAKQTGISPKEFVGKREELFKKYTNSKIQISTIDSFINSILRSFAINIGIRPDFEVGNISDKELLDAFLKNIMKDKEFITLVDFMKSEEKRVEDIQKYFSMLSEKEKEVAPVLTKYLNQDPVSQQAIDEARANILIIAEELKNIIISNPKATKTMINQVAYKDLNELLKKRWIVRDTLNYRTFSKIYTTEMDEILISLQKAIKEYLSKSEIASLQQLSKLYLQYRKSVFDKKRAAEILSYSDITNYAYDIIYNSDISTDMVAFRLDNKVGHLLIDEFQDTSVAQYMILKPLIEEIVAGNTDSQGLEKTLFYVGDPKQSIYRFRGGNQQLFDYVANTHNVKIEHLENNYRSSISVVDFVNNVFGNKYDDYFPQNAISQLAGYVKTEEAEDVLESFIEQLHDLIINKSVSYGNIAVLVQTNKEVEMVRDAIKRSFENKDVPVVTDSSALLIKVPEVQAIIALMKYVFKKERYYLSKFNILTGNEPSAELDVKDLTIYKDDIDVLAQHIVDKFELFNGDLNVIKFLEISSRYKDIEDFYYNVDSLQENITNIEELNAIRILTVHKSKGLEFDNVFVLDRMVRKSNRKSTFLFDYDGVFLDDIKYRLPMREALEPEYKKAVEREEKAEYMDMLNNLYVAFTRAKKRLFIVKSSDFDHSMFSMLNISAGVQGEFGEVSRFERVRNFVQEEYNRIVLDNKFYGKQRYIDNRIKTLNIFDEAFKYSVEVLASLDIDGVNNAIKQVLAKYGAWIDEYGIENIKKMLIKVVASGNLEKYFYSKRMVPVKTAGLTVEYVDFLKVEEDEVRGLILVLSELDIRRGLRVRRGLREIYPDKDISIELQKM